MRAALQLGDPEVATTALDELPQSIVLNSFALRCPGVHHVTRLPKLDGRADRRQLERQLKTTVFTGEKGSFLAGEVESQAHVIDVACDAEPGLHLFDLRAAIAAQAAKRGSTGHA